MNAKVDAMIRELIRVEGGYVDHPNDRGGPTMYGVTQQVARAFGYMGDMRELPMGTARSIFLERFWTAPKFDQVELRDSLLSEELFDTGVNMGVATAGKFLQRALNSFNRQGATYPDITVDGGIGRMTLYALDSFKADRGEPGMRVLTRLCNSQQAVRYLEIGEGNQSQESFTFGWVANRT